MIDSQLILNEYEQQRKIGKEKLEFKKKMLYEKLPRLREIEEEMIQLGIDIGKSILVAKGNQKALLEELEDRQYLLRTERYRILAEHGYPKNFLEMEYVCSKCKDTGFVDHEPCTCYRQKAIRYAYTQSNLQKVLEKENFEYFNFEYYSDQPMDGNLSPKQNIRRIYEKCLDYIVDFDHIDENLLFIGSPGLGKTFLSHCIAKDLLDAGKTVIYQLCGDLVDIVRKNKFDFEKEEAYNQTMHNLYECDFLIIDDFGTESQTNFTQQVIYDILNKRIIGNKKMLLITNLDMSDLLNYSERIYSRILGSFTMYEFIGEDIRLKKNHVI